MANPCDRIRIGDPLGDFCHQCGHVVMAHDDKKLCAVCQAMDDIRASADERLMLLFPPPEADAEEFEIICDMIEIVYAMIPYKPFDPNIAASSRIEKFQAMRERRRGR